MTRPLKELLRGAEVLALSGREDAAISGLRHDSRQVQRGELFFALPGVKTDGNRHLKEAIERGAAAIVSELAAPPAPLQIPAAWIQVRDIAAAMGKISDLFFGHPSGAMSVFGVTGTNGKTTTTYFLESIVRACGGVPAVVGTVDYRMGGKTLQKAPNTTPVSLELLRLLAGFREAGATHAALEVSSHALALKRVEEVDFDAAIFTNLKRDHLDFHKSIEEYFRAKARLFELLVKASSSKRRRLAVLNADDPRGTPLKDLCRGAEIILYGLKNSAEVRAENLALSMEGSSFDLVFRGRKLRARVSLLGEHNLRNALAAAAAALGLGLPEEGVLEGLRALKRVPGRLESVAAGQDFHVLVDYAHTDSAMETVLDCLRRLPHRKIISVFGCGGDRDRGKRGPTGAAACRLSDLAVITSDNPRGEDPLRIIADIVEGIKTAGLKNYKILPEREKAIEEAIAEAGPGDIVLLAGKGHEECQILKDRTIFFDDRVAAREALEKKLR
ncbi:MAG: UDP-N-acetylmuramoyl-L-alanyl-D-glutamate--2,6-diaminopimelate ligase [Elusimicrobia bacterium]|nr:UDP-N-acetylmuramoyl-L-alanyl-D-glutamate--2,6-diaminopimelate ligase [Elusimicrobiota bacterium]